MKKNILILLIITFSIKSFSQVLKKKYTVQDTLYVYFKHNKYESMRGPNISTPPIGVSIEYFFKFKNNDKYFGFEYLSHYRRKGKLIRIPDATFQKNKKQFLKINKDKLLTYCMLKKLDPKELQFFYWNIQYDAVIFLIDRKENNKGEIILRRVNLFGNYPMKL